MFYKQKCKVLWSYVILFIALELVADDPFTVRLFFEPSGRPENDRDYYLFEKENKCVVCGGTDSFVRKNIIPHEYRKWELVISNTLVSSFEIFTVHIMFISTWYNPVKKKSHCILSMLISEQYCDIYIWYAYHLWPKITFSMPFWCKLIWSRQSWLSQHSSFRNVMLLFCRHFTFVMKDHTSHDILLLCLSCHQQSNYYDCLFRRQLSEEYNAPQVLFSALLDCMNILLTLGKILFTF